MSGRRSSVVRALGLGSAAWCMAAAVHGQAPPPVEFLTAVPDAPAFTFLSANPGQIQRPGTLRDLGVALLNGVGPDGRAQQGFALDASVWTLVPGLVIDLGDYQRNRLKYMLANTQFSLGSARAAGDTASTDFAGGVHVTVIDRSDPMADAAFTTELGAALLSACAPAAPGGPAGAGAPAPPSLACVDSVTAARFADWTRANWNRPRLAVAAAAGGTFVDSDTGRRRWAGVDAWAVGSLPLTGSGELIAQARFRQRPTQDTVPSFHSVDLGARAVFGTGTFNLFAEVVTESRSYSDGPTPIDRRSPSSWSGGAEFRVAPNTWLSTGFGSRYSGLGEPDRMLVFGHVRWGVTSAARINTLQ